MQTPQGASIFSTFFSVFYKNILRPAVLSYSPCTRSTQSQRYDKGHFCLLPVLSLDLWLILCILYLYIYIKIWILDSNAGTLIETVCAALSIMQWEYTISVVILTGSVNMGLIFFTPQNCVNGYCWICENGLDFLFFIFFTPQLQFSRFCFCYKAERH